MKLELHDYNLFNPLTAPHFLVNDQDYAFTVDIIGQGVVVHENDQLAFPLGQRHVNDQISIDCTQPFEMHVADEHGNTLFVDNDPEYRKVALANDNDVTNEVLSGSSGLPNVHDGYPMLMSFTVKSSKPFDPMLLVMDCEAQDNAYYLNRFQYDGETVDRDRNDLFVYNPAGKTVRIVFED